VFQTDDGDAVQWTGRDCVHEIGPLACQPHGQSMDTGD
jgi:hypothetical protein